MATITDIYTSLITNIGGIVYPNGNVNPSIVNVDVNIASGWYTTDKINTYMSAGKALISIFKNNYERKPDYMTRTWTDFLINSPTLITSISNNAITLTGTVSTPQHIAILINASTDFQNGYHYNIQSTDTLDTIIYNLSQIIPNSLAVNNVLYIANQFDIKVNIGTVGQSGLNTKRLEQGFTVYIFTPNNSMREILGDAINDGLTVNNRITLPDQFAPFRYMKMNEIDGYEKQNIYCREIYYTVTYQIYQTLTYPTITEVKKNYGAN